MARLRILGLEKSWPRFSLEIDMQAEDGEIVAVLGPSGCGKSSLLRLIAGLERPDGGRILMDGLDIAASPPEKRGIGMVFQDYALFPHLSVRRNIEYGPRMKGVPRAERRRKVEAIAESFEIGRLLERGTYSLSGGECQRVALARALAAMPSVLLLDEPLSSLDPSLRRRLRGEIAARLREASMTAMFVTHDAEEALAVADRIYLLRDGRVESEGLPEELYSSPPTAWSASFLGRGPLLKILSIAEEGGAAVAMTPLGAFRCTARSDAPTELYFPASSPTLAESVRDDPSARGTDRNRLAGRVLSASFAGRFRRIALSCQATEGPGLGGQEVLELELPTSFNAVVGAFLEFEVRAEDCVALE